MSDIAYVKDGVTYYKDGLASQSGPSPLLRAAIEKIGVEKPSDYTLVLEEAGRMEAEEKLMQAFGDDSVSAAEYTAMAHEAIYRRYTALLTASEAFIREAEEMGLGKTSETQLPGSFDALKLATEKLR